MSLEGIWFALIALMLAAYVVLDGLDLGAGILHLVVAREPRERRQILRSIGPVWDGNEVWLLAAGGTAYFAFPLLYAEAISGFYLPVSIVLWALVFRALGVEMKHQLEHPLWSDLWDAAFFAASLVVTLCLGVALGNIVRGFDLDERGRFFVALWTDFTVSDRLGAFDWFTLSVGLCAVAAVALHGATWLAHRTDEEVAARARRLVLPLAIATGALLVAVTAGTFVVRPDLRAAIGARPELIVLPIGAMGSFVALLLLIRRGRFATAFLASGGLLAAMVLAAAATIYPYVLPGRGGRGGVLASAAKTSDYGLRVGLAWWIPGMLLVIASFAWLYRRLPAVVRASEDEHHEDS